MAQLNLKSMWKVAFSFFLLLSQFYLTSSLQGQIRIKFEHFTIEHGLPQNTIYSILQDRRGFLWVGTENGLCRYDGYSFKPYQNDPGVNFTLSYNRVFSICEDSSGALWVGTENGLNKFDRLYERFTRFNHNPENPGETLSNNTVRTIYEDIKGTLWIGTNGGGLNKFNPGSQTFTAYKPEPPEGTAGTANVNSDHCKITTILEDDNNDLWVGTCDGLYTFQREKKIFSRWDIHPPGSDKTGSNQISSIYEDRSRVLWIGTKDGRLLRFNRETGHFIRYQYNSRALPGKGDYPVHSIYEDNTGDFWIGVYNLGLYNLDRERKVSIHYKEQSWKSSGLSSNHIHTIYQDNGGIIWIGTEDGLNKLDKKKKEFAHWITEVGNENSLSDNNVWAICIDKTGILWVGTGKGLNRIDRKTGTFKHYKHDPKIPGTLSHDRVMAICEDSQGVLWLGTQGGGLNRFDKKTGKFKYYIPPPGYEPLPGKSENFNYISHNRVTAILEDHRGVLWIGTQNGGLNKFDRKTETFTYYIPDPKRLDKSLSHVYVSSMFEDKEGILWVGTGSGLNKFHPETETFTHYKNNKDDPESLGNDFISAIYEDQSGILWVGTYFGGLDKLVDRKKGKFVHFRKKHGLPADTINGILEDKKGCLWLSTVNGLSKFDPKKPENNKFKNYFVSYGLQSNEFNGGAWFKADDGEMFFGGVNGFNSFYPGRIIKNLHPPQVVFTDFLVFNKTHLKTSITEMEEVVLSYRDDVFSIEFSALDFSIPENNIYEYKMEGVDPDWVRGGAQKRFVTYTNLNHGEYLFRVRAFNNDGTRSDQDSVLKIIITPPFTKTWWFQLILLVLIILSILTIHRMRTQRLRKKLSEQKRVQGILKQSHDEMEKAKDLAELRHAENEKLLSAISFIFVAVDSSGRIFQWNKPAEIFFGISSVEAVKYLFSDVLKNCINENILHEIIDKGLNQGKSSQMIEFSVDLNSAGKGIRALASSISPITDSTGRTLGFLLLSEDVTNRKEEEMMRNLSKKLESLGLMASGIAHEIKNPLQYISNNADFVNDSFNEVIQFFDNINETAQELEKAGNKEITSKINKLIEDHDMGFIIKEIPKASSHIIKGVSRVSDIIQSMYEFSHPGRGIRDKADINQLLKSTLVMVQSKIRKNADVKLELSQTLPRISCYAGELNQVFMNILINALDAIIESGKWGIIKVTTTVEGKDILIAISDTGSGISTECQNQIFNPFFTTKEVGKGTGQGLSLAQNVIIEKHKGKLDFTSQVGRGTTFYIRLPIKGEI